MDLEDQAQIERTQEELDRKKQGKKKNDEQARTGRSESERSEREGERNEEVKRTNTHPQENWNHIIKANWMASEQLLKKSRLKQAHGRSESIKQTSDRQKNLGNIINNCRN